MAFKSCSNKGNAYNKQKNLNSKIILYMKKDILKKFTLWYKKETGIKTRVTFIQALKIIS